MAKTTTTKKTQKEQEKAPAMPAERLKQWRLGGGIFLLLSGIFITISIISYFFTWQVDQDKVSGNASRFLFSGTEPIANWGGRLGAVLSHALVWNGAGVAALAIGLWVGMLGLSMIYDKRIVPVLRYLRWLSILLLVLAPILAYTIPHSAFSYGGAWGNEAIAFMNGMFGTGGTGMILFALVCFFAFA